MKDITKDQRTTIRGYSGMVEPANRKRFHELAERWEKETVLLSSTDQAAGHPAHREIIGMGEPAVPLILERMQYQGGHWFQALHDITGSDPIRSADHGNVAAMQDAWLDWGKRNGSMQPEEPSPRKNKGIKNMATSRDEGPEEEHPDPDESTGKGKG